MPAQFTILPGLPPYGPMALPFPTNGWRAHCEGIVIQFESQDGNSWIGNFQRGCFQFDKILQHPDGKHVIVIAGGDGYIVDPEVPSNSKQMPGYVTYAEFLPHLDAVLFGDYTEFELLQANGKGWISPRISWDGIKDINIHGNELTGEAYSPIDDKWHPFKLDLLTGTCKDSIYEAQMATAIRIVKK